MLIVHKFGIKNLAKIEIFTQLKKLRHMYRHLVGIIWSNFKLVTNLNVFLFPRIPGGTSADLVSTLYNFFFFVTKRPNKLRLAFPSPSITFTLKQVLYSRVGPDLIREILDQGPVL
jgi:hypothetical protein